MLLLQIFSFAFLTINLIRLILSQFLAKYRDINDSVYTKVKLFLREREKKRKRLRKIETEREIEKDGVTYKSCKLN